VHFFPVLITFSKANTNIAIDKAIIKLLVDAQNSNKGDVGAKKSLEIRRNIGKK
jgi:CRISPR/Cas system CMR-associated protein Cmr1 (group 7 of RAMP superfamily)